MAKMNPFLSIISAAALLAGCGTVSAAASTHHTHHHDPIVEYNLTNVKLAGDGLYSLKVLQSYIGGSGPRIQLIDMPEGALWMTPPGFLGPHEQPLKGWNLWLTPWHAHGGSLWTGARLLRTILTPNVSFQVVGDTGPYTVFEETAHGVSLPYIVNAKTRRVTTMKDPITHNSSLVEDGILAYVSTHQLVASKLSTGEVQSTAIPSVSAASQLTLVSHGITLAGATYPFTVIPALPSLALSRGYRWLSGINASGPIIGIPTNWTIETHNPGGSSYQITAHDPANAKESVTIGVNACVGCSEPDGGLDVVNGPDTPAAGPYPSMHWTNDHITTTTSANGGFMTTRETIVWPTSGGNMTVSWILPASDTALGQELKSSSLAAWRSESAKF